MEQALQELFEYDLCLWREFKYGTKPRPPDHNYALWELKRDMDTMILKELLSDDDFALLTNNSLRKG